MIWGTLPSATESPPFLAYCFLPLQAGGIRTCTIKTTLLPEPTAARQNVLHLPASSWAIAAVGTSSVRI